MSALRQSFGRRITEHACLLAGLAVAFLLVGARARQLILHPLRRKTAAKRPSVTNAHPKHTTLASKPRACCVTPRPSSTRRAPPAESRTMAASSTSAVTAALPGAARHAAASARSASGDMGGGRPGLARIMRSSGFSAATGDASSTARRTESADAPARPSAAAASQREAASASSMCCVPTCVGGCEVKMRRGKQVGCASVWHRESAFSVAGSRCAPPSSRAAAPR